MPMVGGFLGGGVEMTPAGYGTVYLQWAPYDNQNIANASFNFSGASTATVQGNESGWASIVVPVGTYTISCIHTGQYNGDSAKTLIVESTQSYYVMFYGGGPAVTVSAGAGIVVTPDGDDREISLATSGVSAGTVGSATEIPQITVDTFGRVTKKTSFTVYPPTTSGTAGYVWMSRGSGVGYWADPKSLKIISVVFETSEDMKVILPGETTTTNYPSSNFYTTDTLTGQYLTTIQNEYGITAKVYSDLDATLSGQGNTNVYKVSGKIKKYSTTYSNDISIENSTGYSVVVRFSGFAKNKYSVGARSNEMLWIDVLVPSNATLLTDCTIVDSNCYVKQSYTDYYDADGYQYREFLVKQITSARLS